MWLSMKNTFYCDLRISGFWNKYHKQCEKTYPGPMKSVLGGYTNINIFKDVHFEEVLSNIKHITKSSAYRFGEVFLGNGLITSSGINMIKNFAQSSIVDKTFHTFFYNF